MKGIKRARQAWAQKLRVDSKQRKVRITKPIPVFSGEDNAFNAVSFFFFFALRLAACVFFLSEMHVKYSKQVSRYFQWVVGNCSHLNCGFRLHPPGGR